MIELLGVKRTIWRVEAFQPLPDLGPKFDVITAHMICFNGHKSDKALGSRREWEIFPRRFDAIISRRRGRIWLELNREYDGTLLHAGVEGIFRKARR